MILICELSVLDFEDVLRCCGNNGSMALSTGQRACWASDDLGRAPAILVANTQIPAENSHPGSAAAALRFMICEGANFAG